MGKRPSSAELTAAADKLLKDNPKPVGVVGPSHARNLEVLRRSEDLSKPPPYDPDQLTEDQREILEMTGPRHLENGPRQVLGPRHPVSRGGIKRGMNGAFNLKAVSDACVLAGLDPASEIVRVLQSKKQLLDRSGKPVLDADGNPVFIDEIDTETRLRTLNELLQYVQPKLKTVEVKMSGTLDLAPEQLDARLTALLSKVGKAA